MPTKETDDRKTLGDLCAGLTLLVDKSEAPRELAIYLVGWAIGNALRVGISVNELASLDAWPKKAEPS